MTKKATTFLLVTALIGAPIKLNAEDPPQSQFTILEACIAGGIIGILGVLYIGTCIYNHVGNSTSTPPVDGPWTNVPPPPTGTNSQGTNDFGSYTNLSPITISLTNSAPVFMVDVSGLSFQDTNAPGGLVCYFTNAFSATLQAGDSPGGLCTLYRVRAWLSLHGRLMEWSDSNGVPACVVYARWGQTPNVPLTIGTGMEPARFFALTPN